MKEEGLWDRKERRLTSSHCQQEILDRLKEVETVLKEHVQLIQDIHTAIYGNGRDGLMIRHDRVEQTVRIIYWVVGTAWVAIVGLLVKRWLA